MSGNSYTFRPASMDDLPMLERWLQSPEVVRWWGEPAAQLALLREDLHEPLMTMRIVLFMRQPFAFAQDYEVHSWPQNHLSGFPRGTRAIDAFIGQPVFLGRGHGAGFLRALAQRLIAEGAPLVVIDPDVGNVRAQRAYANAGFQGDAVVNTLEGRAVVMVYDEA